MDGATLGHRTISSQRVERIQNLKSVGVEELIAVRNRDRVNEEADDNGSES